MSLKYIIDICPSCGVLLDDINWIPWLKRKHYIRCRFCYNNKIPINSTILTKIQEITRLYYNNTNCIDCKCLLILNGNWRQTSKEQSIYLCNICNNKKTRINKLNNKLLLQNGYGNACNCCNESMWMFLTIDHIYNDGHEERKNIDDYKIKIDLIKNDFPKDRHQLLCMNCNFSKGKNGFCPHIIKNENNNCTFCNIILGDENMFKAHINNNYKICITCSMSCGLGSGKINAKNIGNKRQNLNIKQQIIDNYGGKCVCCGEIEFDFLNIDHINGRDKETDKNKIRGIDLYRVLRRNNYPKDNYQLLCYNCNCSKGFYGKCYHELNREHNKIITIEDYKQLVMNNLV